MTERLFEKYYYSRSFQGGTRPFHDLCRQIIVPGSDLLEMGAGPSNPDSQFLSTLATVTGVDISQNVLSNQYVTHAHVYDGIHLPFEDACFDTVISNWMLEHVEHPDRHFSEVARVLRPGGTYCFRTMNLYHYVSLASRLLPHSFHLLLSNRLRGLADAVDPYETYYRANTRRKLDALGSAAGFGARNFVMIEPEPAYGKAHAVLFYPMMAYERLVNSSSVFGSFRVTILGAFTKQLDH